MAIYIQNHIDLMEDIEKQKQASLHSYTSYEEITERLKKEEFSPVGKKVGVPVSRSCVDQSYGFEVEKQSTTDTLFKYLGIWNC